MNLPMNSPSMAPELLERLKRVRLFLCDVDGVLTDGTIAVGGGSETKVFHIRDGLGLRLLQNEAGIKVGWISARSSQATTVRASELKVDFLHQAPTSKVDAIQEILDREGLTWSELSWMGDDILDLGVLKRAGFSAVPADGVPVAKALAHHVCQAAGGRGAVREVVDLILQAQGHWARIVTRLTEGP